MNRGRIQSQGENIEESEKWNLEQPLTKKKADKKLADLKIKHSKNELKKRRDAFNKASNFINNSHISNGAYAVISKTFMVKNSKSARVDIEVKTGKAFI